MVSDSRILEPGKIKQLENKARLADSKVHLKWPTIDDCVRLVRYIKRDCSGIVCLKTTKGEQLFNVRHDAESPDKIYISPADNSLAPCGWFDIDWLEKRLATDAIVVADAS